MDLLRRSATQGRVRLSSVTHLPMPVRASGPVSKALRVMDSYFSDRQRHSMNTLSIYRPRPSMEIRTPASSSTFVKRSLVNWLPWSVL